MADAARLLAPLRNATSYAALARWLGPWTRESAAPPRERLSLTIAPRDSGERPLAAWYYRPRARPRGAYLIAPGLHFAGPRDPRMDRLCAILAAAGYAVLAPFLPDYCALTVAPACLSDFERAFDALLARPDLPAGIEPGVFSISFGSLPALHLAGRGRHRDRVGALVLFGGYASFHDTIDFCLTGEVVGDDGVRRPLAARDPLNQPVVFMNLIDTLEGAPADPRPLLAAWRRYVETVWGREEMKVEGAHTAVARRQALDVPADARALFLIGCGAEPGARDLARAALARAAGRNAFLDPRPYVQGIRCPVDLVHGVGDDVIPYLQSQALATLLPAEARARVHLTGLYGHTRAAGPSSGLAGELVTMARILEAFVTGAGAHRRGSRR